MYASFKKELKIIFIFIMDFIGVVFFSKNGFTVPRTFFFLGGGVITWVLQATRELQIVYLPTSRP